MILSFVKSQMAFIVIRKEKEKKKKIKQKNKGQQVENKSPRRKALYQSQEIWSDSLTIITRKYIMQLWSFLR